MERLITEATIAEAERSGTIPGEIFCMQAYSTDYPEVHPLESKKALADPDTLYHHQAMSDPDSEQFEEAMVKEVTDQLNNGNFTIILKKDLPKGALLFLLCGK